MKNQICDNRNMFGDMDTQKWAQAALPILVSRAQNEDIILMHELVGKIAPHLTQFNFAMRWVLGSIHTTLYELERRDDWSYGDIPGITAIVLSDDEKPTEWIDEQTRVDPNTPLLWKEFKEHHILPVFEYPYWDKVMDFVVAKLDRDNEKINSSG